MTSVYPGSQFWFGAGAAFATQTNASGVITPVEIGVMQDISIDYSGEIKPIYGKNQYAIALGRGKVKIEGKAKFAKFSMNIINTLFFGGTPSTGQITVVENESQTITAGSVTPANKATFLSDLGPYYATTGVAFTYTASAAPATAGTYNVTATGTYKFATADNTQGVYLNYTYTAVTGKTLLLPNSRMGVAPSFKLVVDGIYDSKQCTLTFNQCVSAKMTLPTKIDDWLIGEVDFQVAADASGNIGTINLSQ